MWACTCGRARVGVHVGGVHVGGACTCGHARRGARTGVGVHQCQGGAGVDRWPALGEQEEEREREIHPECDGDTERKVER